MAHAPDTVARVRLAYIRDRMPITAIADRFGVARGTVARWKEKAAAQGDDWDRARTVSSLMGQGHDSVIMLLVEDQVRMHQAVMEDLKTGDAVDPVQKVKLLATLADAFTKTMNAAARSSPQVSKLAVAQDVLHRLSDFVIHHFPEHAEAFVQILEPFGKALGQVYD